MGSVYSRPDSPFLWLAYIETDGRRRLVSSRTDDRAKAERRLAELERRVAAERAAGVTAPAKATVRWYVEQRWQKERAARQMRSAKQDGWRLTYILPELGSSLLKDVDRLRILEFMRGLRSKGLAQRSQRLIYAGLRVIFADAVADGLIPFTPCTLRQRRGELPKSEDREATWRAGAIFTRNELETLISDSRVPEWRRVLWASIFLTGARIGEVLPRRWRDLDSRQEPLSRLSIHTHWDFDAKMEVPGTKGRKSGREVPVHRTLGILLAQWKLSGWARRHGQPPKDEDLIFGSLRGRDGYSVLNRNSTYRLLAKDCATLGLRQRRQHDARRTFVSLCLADGADKNLLRWVTHGAPEGEGDMMDVYNTPPWATLCEQVSKLKVGTLGSATLELREAVSQVGTIGSTGMFSNARKGYLPPIEAHHVTQRPEDKGGGGSASATSVRGGASERINVATTHDYEERARRAGFQVKP